MRQRVIFLEKFNDLIKSKYPNGNLIGVEVGSFKGESGECFAKSGNFKTLYCIDRWENNYDTTNKDDSSKVAEQAEIDFDKMALKFNNIIKIKKTSQDASKDFEDRSLDFVYIDAEHSYEGAKSDILTWSKKIKLGGILAGHDYTKYWQGVVKAVKELVDLDYVDKRYNWADFDFQRLKK